MNTYRVRLKPKTGSLVSALPGSGTMFGAICWAVRDLYGVEELEEMLDNFLAHDCRFAVSSVFPYGLLPMPKGIVQEQTNRIFPQLIASVGKDDTDEFIRRKKKLVKIKYINEDLWNEIKSDTARMNEFIFKYISGQYEEYGEPFVEETFIRNAINRLSNTTTKGESSVFYSKVYSIKEVAEFHCFIKTSNINWFEPVWKYLSECGIGSNKSVGMNLFELTCEGKVKVDLMKKNLLVSKYIPNPDEVDFNESYYEIQSAIEKFESCREFFHTSPNKAKINYIAEGSVISLKTDRELYGSVPVVREISSRKIRSNGLALFI